MQTLIDDVRNLVWTVLHRPNIGDIVDILVVAFLLYKLLMLTRQTRAFAVLKGLGVLILSAWISDFLGLTALNWIIRQVVNNGALVLVVLFQPELRKALEQMGRSFVRKQDREADVRTGRAAVREISDCLLRLSRRKVGALIVVERKVGLNDVIETGTALNAAISSELLENIFEPNTPLHDGAVVMRDNQIVAAACILPLTEEKGLSRSLGTRHRAAIGVTETTDALSLIVSEETGVISAASNGIIRRNLSEDELEALLQSLFVHEDASLWDTFRHPKTKKERREYLAGQAPQIRNEVPAQQTLPTRPVPVEEAAALEQSPSPEGGAK